MLWWTLRQLKSKDPNVRAKAVEKLASSKGLQRFDPLATALADESAQVRAAAAEAMRVFRGDSVIKVLFAAGLRERDATVRQALVETLVVMLRSGPAESRYYAAQALREIKDPHAGDGLIEAVRRDPDPNVRRGCLGALCEVKDPRVVDILLEALSDGELQYVAVDGLRGFPDPRAVEPLIALLGAKDASVRMAAAWTLREIGDARAVEALVPLLRDSDSHVREAAQEALEKIGGPDAERVLAEYRVKHK